MTSYLRLSQPLEYLGALIACYVLAKAIYRVLFHPLRCFTGPILAAVTEWNKLYYNWYCEGLTL
jgi:hypothetical protein